MKERRKEGRKKEEKKRGRKIGNIKGVRERTRIKLVEMVRQSRKMNSGHFNFRNCYNVST